MKFPQLQKHKIVGLDTNLFIYLIEGKGILGQRARELFMELERRRMRQVCSAVVITELLQQPIKHEDKVLVNEYQRILLIESPLEFRAIDVPVATRAAQLVAANNLKTPDALHLAAVLEAGATAFITADKKIKAPEEIEIIYL